MCQPRITFQLLFKPKHSTFGVRFLCARHPRADPEITRVRDRAILAGGSIVVPDRDSIWARPASKQYSAIASVATRLRSASPEAGTSTGSTASARRWPGTACPSDALPWLLSGGPSSISPLGRESSCAPQGPDAGPSHVGSTRRGVYALRA